MASFARFASADGFLLEEMYAERLSQVKALALHRKSGRGADRY